MIPKARKAAHEAAATRSTTALGNDATESNPTSHEGSHAVVAAK